MKNIVLILVFFSSIASAQLKPCAPDSIQVKLYSSEIVGTDTTFLFPYNMTFNFKKYNYKNCLKPYTISKLRQVFRGEIDYLPQELRRSREIYYLAMDTPKKILKVKKKYAKDSLTTEMAIDTLLKESSMKKIIPNITHSLSLSREKLILDFGQIYLVEMIPDLQWALTQDSTIYPPLQIKLALARMGVKKFQDHFMNFYKGFVTEVRGVSDIGYAKNLQELKHLRGKRQLLQYINTQESWDLFLQENLSPNILKYCLSGCEYISYRKEKIIHPNFFDKKLEKNDELLFNEMFNAGPSKGCYSMESPEKAREDCPKGIGKFLYDINKKYIKDFVMPYDFDVGIN